MRSVTYGAVCRKVRAPDRSPIVCALGRSRNHTAAFLQVLLFHHREELLPTIQGREYGDVAVDGEASGDVLHVLFVTVNTVHDDETGMAARRGGARYVGRHQGLIVAWILDLMGSYVGQGIDRTGRQNCTRHAVSPEPVLRPCGG